MMAQLQAELVDYAGISVPHYATISRWCEMTGMSRTGVYNALGRKDLRAIKAGGRTLIDVHAGLEWLRSLPAAEIAAPKDGA